MSASLAASLVDLVLGLELGARGDADPNRFTLEGVRWTAGQDGTRELRIARLEATALRLATGSLVLEIERIAVHELVARLHAENGSLRVGAIEARDAEFAGLKLHGPLVLPRPFRQLWEATHPPTARRCRRRPMPGSSARSARSTAPCAAASPTRTCCSMPT